ncbi:MAG TPA: helix-turn-helix transcriptional regulator [Clostridia bacterium]|nr:helix-turn-helix transcriptional regulator [Clostridia bacterium]
MSIGNRIRERRESLGLTLEEIGTRLGVNRSTVKRYESGETKRIPISTIKKLASILNTTPEYLLGLDQSKEGSGNKEEFDPDVIILARLVQNIPKEKREMLGRIIHTMSEIADEEMKK